MDNFPGNAHRPPRPPEEPKKVERIVTSEVRRRKTPRGRRMAKTFFGGDVQSTGSFILGDIVAPMLRDLFFTVVKDGAERIIYQDGGPRGGYRPGRGGPTDYRGMSSRPAAQPRTRSNRSSYEVDDLVFDTRVEASEILDRLEFYLDRYSQVSVSDLYGLVGIPSTSMDVNWGWTDLSGASIRHHKGDYVLILPRSESLK